MDDLALIIEDDEDLSIIFAEAVRNAGYQVEMIRDGQSAQKRLKEANPDLIILDMHLPHVSGPDLFNQIQEDKRMKDCIVVIATADARMGDAYTTKADFVLIKPISYVQLRDLTARLKNNSEDAY
ncbi:MAG: response regulator [Anaerolineales bacterium]|nr:response regulator [Anaerolineales bacterium]